MVVFSSEFNFAAVAQRSTQTLAATRLQFRTTAVAPLLLTTATHATLAPQLFLTATHATHALPLFLTATLATHVHQLLLPVTLATHAQLPLHVEPLAASHDDWEAA